MRCKIGSYQRQNDNFSRRKINDHAGFLMGEVTGVPVIFLIGNALRMKKAIQDYRIYQEDTIY
jgi:hypothetical protein